jgi:hypothetical protein
MACRREIERLPTKPPSRILVRDTPPDVGLPTGDDLYSSCGFALTCAIQERPMSSELRYAIDELFTARGLVTLIPSAMYT